MLIHDIIKIRLVEEGYFKDNYPYHLISDSEMCDMFIGSDDSYFYSKYPCVPESIEFHGYYDALVRSIKYHIEHLKRDASTFTEEPESARSSYKFPDWVYSYMLGIVISVDSSARDIHDLSALLGLEKTNDSFDSALSQSCFEVSKKWINKTQTSQSVLFEGEVVYLRPYTIFGEPHVIKALRLEQADPIGR